MTRSTNNTWYHSNTQPVVTWLRPPMSGCLNEQSRKPCCEPPPSQARRLPVTGSCALFYTAAISSSHPTQSQTSNKVLLCTCPFTHHSLLFLNYAILRDSYLITQFSWSSLRSSLGRYTLHSGFYPSDWTVSIRRIQNFHLLICRAFVNLLAPELFFFSNFSPLCI